MRPLIYEAIKSKQNKTFCRGYLKLVNKLPRDKSPIYRESTVYFTSEKEQEEISLLRK